MKTIYLIILISISSILCGMEDDDYENFLKKKIYSPVDQEYFEDNYFDLQDMKSADLHEGYVRSYHDWVKFFKIEFEYKALKNPVFCMASTTSLFEIYTQDSLLYSSYSEKHKILNMQSYESGPVLIYLNEVPSCIYIKLADESIPFFDVEDINIGEAEDIYNFALEINRIKLIDDQFYFYQAVSLFIIGLIALIVFFVFGRKKTNLALLLFGLMGVLSGLVQYRTSALSIFLNPFTLVDYSLFMIGYVAIFTLLFLFIKVFFNLNTKRFIFYIVSILILAVILNFMFKIPYVNRQFFTILHLILMIEVFIIVIKQDRFSTRAKWVILLIFGFSALLSLADIVVFFDDFTLFGTEINLIAVGLVYLLFEHYRQVYKERTDYKLKIVGLERQNIEAELNSLKRQIDPHFLFNSLNTLISLIDFSKETASEFVQELSNVYHYVLRIQKKDIIPIDEELKFVESYMFLMKQRFHGNLTIEFNISPETESKYIVPAAIQLLVENAVKHNVVSQSHPLNIQVYSKDDQSIIVENNLQIKQNSDRSEKIGLDNLRKRLSFFTDRQIDIRETSDSFVVVLPLIDEIQ